MSLRFALRGTSLNAWYSYGGRYSAPYGNIVDDPAVTANANAGVFGGSVINMITGSVTKGLIFPGGLNLGATNNNGSVSVLARIVPSTTVSPFAGFGCVQTGSVFGNHSHAYRCGITSAGHPYFQLHTLAGATTSYIGTSTINATINVPFDVMFTWDGTSSANTIKFSKDGVELETMTSTNTCANRNVRANNSFVVGTITAGATPIAASLNELLIWDTVEAHTYTARTTFWDVPEFDGSKIPSKSGFNGFNSFG